MVSLTAEPTPALPSGSDVMIEVVAGAIDMANPVARITRHPASRAYGVSVPRVDASARPTATTERPAAITHRAPKRSTTFELMGAMSMMVRGAGRECTPAPRAE